MPLLPLRPRTLYQIWRPVALPAETIHGPQLDHNNLGVNAPKVNDWFCEKKNIWYPQIGMGSIWLIQLCQQ